MTETPSVQPEQAGLPTSSQQQLYRGISLSRSLTRAGVASTSGCSRTLLAAHLDVPPHVLSSKLYKQAGLRALQAHGRNLRARAIRGGAAEAPARHGSTALNHISRNPTGKVRFSARACPSEPGGNESGFSSYSAPSSANTAAAAASGRDATQGLGAVTLTAAHVLKKAKSDAGQDMPTCVAMRGDGATPSSPNEDQESLMAQLQTGDLPVTAPPKALNGIPLHQWDTLMIAARKAAVARFALRQQEDTSEADPDELDAGSSAVETAKQLEAKQQLVKQQRKQPQPQTRTPKELREEEKQQMEQVLQLLPGVIRPMEVVAQMAAGSREGSKPGQSGPPLRRPELTMFGNPLEPTETGLMSRVVLLIQCEVAAAEYFEGDNESAATISQAHRDRAAVLTGALLSFHGLAPLPYDELLHLALVIQEMKDDLAPVDPHTYCGHDAGLSIAMACSLLRCAREAFEAAILPHLDAGMQAESSNAVATLALMMGPGLSTARHAGVAAGNSLAHLAASGKASSNAVVHAALVNATAERALGLGWDHLRRHQKLAMGRLIRNAAYAHLDVLVCALRTITETRLPDLYRKLANSALSKRRSEARRKAVEQRPRRQNRQQAGQQLRRRKGGKQAVVSTAAAAAAGDALEASGDVAAEDAESAAVTGLNETAIDLRERILQAVPWDAYASPACVPQLVLRSTSEAAAADAGVAGATHGSAVNPWVLRTDLARVLLATCLDGRRTCLRVAGSAAVQLATGATAAAIPLLSSHHDALLCHRNTTRAGAGTSMGVSGAAGSIAQSWDIGGPCPALVAMQVLPWRVPAAGAAEGSTATSTSDLTGLTMSLLPGDEMLRSCVEDALEAKDGLARWGIPVLRSSLEQPLGARLKMAMSRHKRAVLQCHGREALDAGWRAVMQMHMALLRCSQQLVVVPVLRDRSNMRAAVTAGAFMRDKYLGPRPPQLQPVREAGREGAGQAEEWERSEREAVGSTERVAECILDSESAEAPARYVLEDGGGWEHRQDGQSSSGGGGHTGGVSGGQGSVAEGAAGCDDAGHSRSDGSGCKGSAEGGGISVGDSASGVRGAGDGTGPHDDGVGVGMGVGMGVGSDADRGGGGGNDAGGGGSEGGGELCVGAAGCTDERGLGGSRSSSSSSVGDGCSSAAAHVSGTSPFLPPPPPLPPRPPPPAASPDGGILVPGWQWLWRFHFNHELCRLLGLHKHQQSLLARGYTLPLTEANLSLVAAAAAAAGGAVLGGSSAASACAQTAAHLMHLQQECERNNALFLGPETRIDLVVLDPKDLPQPSEDLLAW